MNNLASAYIAPAVGTIEQARAWAEQAHQVASKASDGLRQGQAPDLDQVLRFDVLNLVILMNLGTIYEVRVCSTYSPGHLLTRRRAHSKRKTSMRHALPGKKSCDALKYMDWKS